MPRPYVHLHVHTEHSLLDGLGGITTTEKGVGYVERAVQLGMPALAITDHGQQTGALQFYHECRKQGIEPIIGSEFYFVPDAQWRPAKGEPAGERYHVVILARGATGYEVMSELMTTSHKQYHYKPLIDRANLEALGDDARHLVVLSGCAGSIVSELVRAGDLDAAAHELSWWRETFPHFYVELQHHDTAFDRQLNTGLVELARRYDLPWVITNDPHYVVPEDECFHDTLLAIQTASDIDDPNRFRFDGTGYHLRSREEMRAAFRQYGKDVWRPGLDRTVEVAQLCHTRIPSWEARTWQLPQFPDTDDAFAMLKKLAYRRLSALGLREDPVYLKQLRHELRVIKQAGISDFLLINWDIIREARRRGIRVGPGRGSVAGTLVGYLAGVHKIDPIRYKLLFERFLNPERPRMPDIDTDYAPSGRDDLIEYAVEKYGAENVMRVCTYSKMGVKKAFKSLAKAHGISFMDANRLSGEIAEDEEHGFVLPEEITAHYPDLAVSLDRLRGTKVSISRHASGVIIAAPSVQIRRQVPEMYVPSSKQFVGQFDLEAAEDVGLMKMDFLGLRTLDTIDECLRLIRERTGEEVEPDDWVPDEEEGDDEVYAMLAAGRTGGVFQMEGPVNQRGCREVQPSCFEDLVSITSLYRTGPIAAKFPEAFVNNRRSGRVKYAHPSLKPILEPTWGVILYQEQVMEIAATCAGFDMVMVDDIKEAIKHKKSKLMESMKPAFIKGCRRTVGMERKAVELLWSQIEGYSGYSYNRSHAVAYTMVTYQTARLKKLWPLEYYTALLRTVDPDKAGKVKREGYMMEAVDTGFPILPPDINLSEGHAIPHPERDAILLGFADYAGIGDTTARKIVAGRPRRGYRDPEEVKEVVNNVKAFSVLRDGGALASLDVPGIDKRMETLLSWQFKDRMRKYRKRYAEYVVLPEEDGDECCILGEIVSATRGTTKNGKPYVTWKLRYSISHTFDVRLWSETKRHWGLGVGSVVMVAGAWEGRWQNISCGSPRSIEVVKRVETPQAKKEKARAAS